MRQLLPVPDAPDVDASGPEPAEVDLLDRYDWPSTTWLRACMVIGLDGGIAGPEGLSGSISSPTDRSVMAAIRAHSDAILVGARTIRAEAYNAVRAKDADAQARAESGQRPAPVLAIASASCRFPWPAVRFTGSDEQAIILTTEAAQATDRAAATEAGCEVIVAGEQSVDPAEALAALHARGLTRIVTEGGPTLLRQFDAGSLVDELDLTIAPRVGTRTPVLTALPNLVEMRLLHVLEDDGFLFTRYVRPDAPC